MIHLYEKIYTMRYKGDIITGTIEEIESYIRKVELTTWIAYLTK